MDYPSKPARNNPNGITSKLEELETHLHLLTEKVENLRSNVLPVLSSAAGIAPKKQEAIKSPSSPYSEKILMLISYTDTIADRIDEIINNLDF